MKYDFIIFGGTGLQGRICARDLLESGYSALLAGRDPSGIRDLLKNKKAGFVNVNLYNYDEIIKTINNSGAKIVVNCAELVFNISIMNACLELKRSCTDLGGLQHVTKKQFELDSKFKKSKIACLTGCGSTPGIANVMVKYAVEQLDSVKNIDLGFVWDSNIKKFIIPYSIQSIFDEFTQEPVAYHEGKFMKENRLKSKKEKNFKEIGKQDVYCIVHSEVYSFERYFKNKGLKNIHYYAGFPKHSIDSINRMIELGFNSEKELEISGVKIRPIDFTTKVLKKIKIPKDYKEIEDLWAEIEGRKDNKKKKIKMDCIVRTQKGWEEAGSNIDTGRTMSIMSQMLFEDKIKGKGVFAPEAVIPCEPFFRELSRRKMYIYQDNKKIN